MSHGTLQRDHPRVCGEHIAPGAVAMTLLGSSPRMRGTHLTRRGEQIRPGIIPAYAGNTQRFLIQSPMTRDHPRVCGEHAGRRPDWRRFQGSSPRMRGTLGRYPYRPHPFGIIPAYAGNTTAAGNVDTPRWDHPRVCGEHKIMGSVTS